MQLVEAFEKLVEEYCLGPIMVVFIKTANKSMSKQRNVNYLMTLSPEDELGIKNKEMCWICREQMLRIAGKRQLAANII